MRKMSKYERAFLVAAIALLSCAFAPSIYRYLFDIRLPGAANYQVVGRGLTWASGVNQNWIMDVTGPASGVCVNIQNNDAGTHTFSITSVITSDLAQTTYTGQTGHWTSAVVSPSTVGSVAGSSTQNWWIDTAGAARFVLIISGGSGAGTADITLSQTSISCTGAGASQQGSVCNSSAVQSVAVSTTVTMVAAPPAGQFIHVCAYVVGGDVATNGTVVQFSYGATCAAVGTVVWQVSPHTGGSNYQQGSGIGQLFQTRTAAQPLCLTQGASGATQFVSVSYIVY